jgi:hypothetical protein
MSLGEYSGAGSAITLGLYHFNGSSNDYSGNGNNGTNTGMTFSSANAKIGSQGAGFNGSTSKILVNQLSIGTGIRSFSFWLKTTSNIADNPTIIDYVVTSSTNDRFSIRILGSDTGTPGRLRVYARGAAGQAVYSDSTIALNDGIWRHIFVIIDVANVTITIYVNGSLNQGSQTGTTLSSIDGTGTMMIGAVYNSSTYFAMCLDEFIIENRSWTAVAVKKLYTYQKGRFGI